jgi:hypothetical protein
MREIEPQQELLDFDAPVHQVDCEAALPQNSGMVFELIGVDNLGILSLICGT